VRNLSQMTSIFLCVIQSRCGEESRSLRPIKRPREARFIAWPLTLAIAASLAMLLSACSTQSASHPSDQFGSREVIFVTNAVDNSVNIYPIGSRGDSGPVATIKGPATGLDDPVSIALASSGKIYVLNNGTAGNSASIEVFAPGSRGNVAPIARIAGPATRLLSVNRIAVDSAGQIYVAIEVVDIDSQPAGILVYPPGSNGNVTPSATIGGVESEIQNPWGIAIDLQGDILVAEAATDKKGRLLVFPAGTQGEAKPRFVLEGNDERLIAPTAIAVDSGGIIYVANGEGHTMDGAGISVFREARSDSSAPTLVASIKGLKTGLMDDPVALISGIAIDSRRNIYVTIPATRHNPVSRIVVFAAGSDREVVPRAVIVGLSTKLSGPSGIAIGPYPGTP
jgi:hypothetical protein